MSADRLDGHVACKLIPYLCEKHVADGEDGLDAAKELLLLLVANGAELPQRPGIDVVDGPQADEEFALGIEQILRQPKPRIRFCGGKEKEQIR